MADLTRLPNSFVWGYGSDPLRPTAFPIPIAIVRLLLLLLLFIRSHFSLSVSLFLSFFYHSHVSGVNENANGAYD